MIIQLDLQSETPIYAQLCNQIMEGIASGQLKPGDPLPSVRSLAADIGINLHTVNKSYTLLKADGFIQIHRQKGVVIQPDSMPTVTKEYEAKLSQELRPIIAEAIVRNMSAEQLKQIVSELYQHIKNPD
ncbi:GntR family transcriptional regulator [Paenibacillus sp. N1-5-1-14]|uniref:GntR family transcriptional regulator n=1 Tax=Paenibacillus radicibacter TaxID=2972488 RepID=UPI002159813B|nr:GntR family transcriptional regulator [Paenibacillus radicibacter]MCR8643103.1 GntR family transcriptional regulator [Paenibacillus radicibacter]